MNADRLLEANLEIVERAIARVCLQAGLRGADAEDFASSVNLALLADDCAILRKFEGRSSLATYLTVVIRRMLVDQQRAQSRWSASAEAQRRGAAAVTLERLLHRDRHTLDEAVAAAAAAHPDLSEREFRDLAAALPDRMPRTRFVSVDDESQERIAAPSAADERVVELDRLRCSAAAGRVVRETMDSMSAQDRLILRLRFAGGVAIADIARALALEQRPLYRRVEALLRTLRATLEQRGIDEASAAELIGEAAGERLDFGLSMENGDSPPSLDAAGERADLRGREP